MADGTPITDANSVTEEIATDELVTLNGVDVSGANPRIKAQRIKVTFGSDGIATDVDATHPLPVTLGSEEVTVLAGPAASRQSDSISAALAADAVMLGLSAVTPQFAPINATASGVNAIVGPFAGKKIRVLAWNVIAAAAVNVKWQTSTGPADLTGLYEFSANGGIVVPFCPVGLFETGVGDTLDLNLSIATNVGGSLVYIQV